MPQARQFSVLRYPVYSQPVAYVVEKHVAGLGYSLMQVYPPMDAMAVEVSSIETGASTACHLEVVVDNTCFKTSQRHDGFEGGPGAC